MRQSFPLRTWAPALCAIVLITVVLFIIPAAGMSGTASDREASSPTQAPADLRWLALIRASAARRAPNSAGTPSPTVNLHLTDRLVAGYVNNGATVAISMTRASELLDAITVTPFPDGAGYLYVGSFVDKTAYGPLQAGDVVWVIQSGTVASMTVPALDALAEAGVDQVTGHAPTHAPVAVYVYAASSSDGPRVFTTMANNAGRYQVNLAGQLDLRPRDSGYVNWQASASTQAFARFVTPFLRAQVYGHSVYGLAAPYSTITLTASDGSGTWLSASTSALDDGSFRVLWGQPASTQALQPGDQVQASAAGQVFSMTVADLNAQADLAAHAVQGYAEAGQRVEVYRFAGPLQSEYDDLWMPWQAPLTTPAPAQQISVTASPTGTFAATLALTAGNYGAALVTSAQGNQTYARYSVPYLFARLGMDYQYGPTEDPIRGQVTNMGMPVTLTIYGPSGYPMDIRQILPADNGYFVSGYSSSLLKGGERTNVMTASGESFGFDVPELTAEGYTISDTVTGMAPPGSRLTVQASVWTSWPNPTPPMPTLPPVSQPQTNPVPNSPLPPNGGYDGSSQTILVTANEQGHFIADFSSYGDLVPGSTGKIILTTAQGYQVLRWFTVLQGCEAHLFYVQVAGSRVTGNMTGCSNSGAYLRLRDGNGQLKVEQWVSRHYYDNEFDVILSTAGITPVQILPGDVLELEYGDQIVAPTRTPMPLSGSAAREAPAQIAGNRIMSFTVPALTLSIDPGTNAVTGHAPPGAELQLTLFAANSTSWGVTTTAGAGGSYQFNLDSSHALVPGARAEVLLVGSRPPYFYVADSVPVLLFYLNFGTAGALVSPGARYTISIQSGTVVTPLDIGYANAQGGIPDPPSIPQTGITYIVATAQRVLTLPIPNLSIWLDRATATFHGIAPSNASLNLLVRPLPAQDITATASGAFTATIPATSMTPHALGQLTYQFSADAQAWLDFALPQWQIVLDSPCVLGAVEDGRDMITVQLHAPDGSLVESTPALPDRQIGKFFACFAARVQSGDQLSTIRAGQEMSLTVPLLTARHDYARQTVTGQAMPGVSVILDLQHQGSVLERIALTDGAGRFGLDTSAMSLNIGDKGTAMIVTRTGDVIKRYFTVTGYQAYMPLTMHSQ